MKAKELIKLAEKAGWKLDRIHGSHHIFLHPEKPYRLSIPVHGNKDLGKGIAHKLLKQAGLI